MLAADSERSDGVGGGGEDPLLPGPGQNPPAEEDYSGLRIVLVQNLPLRPADL